MAKPKLNNRCINCGENLIGKYCFTCGQKKIVAEDKKLRHFIEEFFSSLFIADGKILNTFKNIFFKPGKVSRAFIEGNRKKYLSPLRVFFFANLIYFLFPFLNTFNTNLYTQLNRQFYSTYATKLVHQHLEKGDVTYNQYRAEFEKKSNSLGKLLLILLVIIQAIIMRLIFIGRKDLFLTDFLSASSYFTSFYILTFLVIFPFIVAAINQIVMLNENIVYDNNVLTLILIVGIFIYLMVFLKRAFQINRVQTVGAAILLTILLLPTIVLYRFILFLVSHFMVI